MARKTTGPGIGAVPSKRKVTKPIPRPNRQRLKKQITVRIDEDLLKAVLRRAELDELRLTDEIERGLWLVIQGMPEQGEQRQGRILWNKVPLDYQRDGVGFWTFIHEPFASPPEEVLRKHVKELIRKWREEDPRHLERLERLAKSSEGKEESAS